MFALIIGINTYSDSNIPNLSGAAADADAVEEFLISKIGVDRNRIVSLRDEKATRHATIQAFKNLAVNSAIAAEDPILVYYAGHGGEARPLPHSEHNISSANGMIQMLIPHDFAMSSSNSPVSEGQGVLDVTLSHLLARIAKNKSDNITFVADCCHAGSIDRGSNSENDDLIISRGIDLGDNYFVHDQIVNESMELVGARSSAIFAEDEKLGIMSHVLLAACKLGQTAKEINGRGSFTKALLDLLYKEGVANLTYDDVIQRIPALPYQHPQCIGVNHRRILFDSKATIRYGSMYILREKFDKKDDKDLFILEAGLANSVSIGSIFEVYSDSRRTSFIGSVVATKVAPFSTECSVLPSIASLLLSGHPAYAVQKLVGKDQNISIFIDPNDPFYERFRELGEQMRVSDPDRRSFYLVTSKDDDKPDLAISTHDSLVRFHITHPDCVHHGITHMAFDSIYFNDNSTPYLVSILRNAADFYWYLNHSEDASRTISEEISLECFRLVPNGQFTEDWYEVLVPDGENLNVGNKIYIDVSQGARYGFKIVNNSATPFYASLFYFDPNDLNISECYTPGKAAQGQADFSLSPKGSLTIGYGDGGAVPRTYCLRKNQNMDVGILKLYLSTRYVDYSEVAQNSPSRGVKLGVRAKKEDLWGALTIPIVQGRGEPHAQLFKNSDFPRNHH